MADRVERALFNAGPATVSRDFKSHIYFQSPKRFANLSPDFPHGPRAGGGPYRPKHSPLAAPPPSTVVDFDRPKSRDADVNRITKMQYNAAGQVIGRVALDPKADGNEAGQQADNQATRYVYADELTDKGSSIPRNDLLRAVIYPDSDDTVVNGVLDDGADEVFDRFEYTYHADGSMAIMADPRGVVHEYAYDLLGRRTADSATSLGRTNQNVDGFVRMIGTACDALGRRSSVTSYGDSAGTVVRNQIAWSYDEWGNVTASQQAHDGAVTTGTPALNSLGASFMFTVVIASATRTPRSPPAPILRGEDAVR